MKRREFHASFLLLSNPFLHDYPRQYGYGRAIEGGQGCMRACMVHLEQRGKLKNKFTTPFREPGHQRWRVDRSNPDKVAKRVQEEYINTGNYENFDDYIRWFNESNLNKKSDGSAPNYGFGLGNDDE